MTKALERRENARLLMDIKAALEEQNGQTGTVMPKSLEQKGIT